MFSALHMNIYPKAWLWEETKQHAYHDYPIGLYRQCPLNITYHGYVAEMQLVTVRNNQHQFSHILGKWRKHSFHLKTKFNKATTISNTVIYWYNNNFLNIMISINFSKSMVLGMLQIFTTLYYTHTVKH